MHSRKLVDKRVRSPMRSLGAITWPSRKAIRDDCNLQTAGPCATELSFRIPSEGELARIAHLERNVMLSDSQGGTSRDSS